MNEIPQDLYCARLLIDGEFYEFDFNNHEVKEFRQGKFRKFKNKMIKPHCLDKLALLGISLRKMTKIIEYLREIDENEN